MTQRIQLFSEDEITQYFTLDSTDVKDVSDSTDDEVFFEARIMMTEQKQIHKRQVMGLMQFLGDAGGYQGSLVIIGAALNFIFSSNDSSIQLLSNFFLVNSSKFKSSNKRKWLSSFKQGSPGAIGNLVFGSILKYTPCLGYYSKTAKMKHKLDKVNSEFEQALDVRSILLQRSQLLAAIRVLIYPENLNLLKLQRHGQLISMQEHNDSFSQLLSQ